MWVSKIPKWLEVVTQNCIPWKFYRIVHNNIANNLNRLDLLCMIFRSILGVIQQESDWFFCETFTKSFVMKPLIISIGEACFFTAFRSNLRTTQQELDDFSVFGYPWFFQVPRLGFRLIFLWKLYGTICNDVANIFNRRSLLFTTFRSILWTTQQELDNFLNFRVC